ncbi:acetyltransferase [Desulfosporosinus acidiphilus SJ4]|uniref:Acetyltransferase n=1 Tax=Desulfosporosinus acidiphilus (strain DSM 22704 / JCM 16185 / SJ4) TaxID=646529 RepID=I4D102_DESAJ|nr:GNAT family N-acetyltransferase [Desulfosporosinus acidiphilus]AFM39476.1 acetyltransferase [Desulfosporosinus acidiphilus SJ4]
MEITYKTTKDFTVEQLQDLFLSVKWSSGNYPDKLQVAMKNSHSVVSAWYGEKLVGLINCLSDGAMTAYFHYLLVRPEHQNQGIGKELVNSMLKSYEKYARKVLIAYDTEIGFYKKCGFDIGEASTPMFITYLTT